MPLETLPPYTENLYEDNLNSLVPPILGTNKVNSIWKQCTTTRSRCFEVTTAMHCSVHYREDIMAKSQLQVITINSAPWIVSRCFKRGLADISQNLGRHIYKWSCLGNNEETKLAKNIWSLTRLPQLISIIDRPHSCPSLLFWLRVRARTSQDMRETTKHWKTRDDDHQWWVGHIRILRQTSTWCIAWHRCYVESTTPTSCFDGFYMNIERSRIKLGAFRCYGKAW